MAGGGVCGSGRVAVVPGLSHLTVMGLDKAATVSGLALLEI